MLLIVCLHASVMKRLRVEGGAYGYLIDLPLNLVFWIAVPFFFLASGYFFGKRVDRGHEPLELLRESAWPLLLLFVYGPAYMRSFHEIGSRRFTTMECGRPSALKP
jgi:surface polysaccharide O-acyltransferase-like enzyme